MSLCTCIKYNNVRKSCKSPQIFLSYNKIMKINIQIRQNVNIKYLTKKNYDNKIFRFLGFNKN